MTTTKSVVVFVPRHNFVMFMVVVPGYRCDISNNHTTRATKRFSRESCRFCLVGKPQDRSGGRGSERLMMEEMGLYKIFVAHNNNEDAMSRMIINQSSLSLLEHN